MAVGTRQSSKRPARVPRKKAAATNVAKRGGPVPSSSRPAGSKKRRAATSNLSGSAQLKKCRQRVEQLTTELMLAEQKCSNAVAAYQRLASVHEETLAQLGAVNACLYIRDTQMNAAEQQIHDLTCKVQQTCENWQGLLQACSRRMIAGADINRLLDTSELEAPYPDILLQMAKCLLCNSTTNTTRQLQF